MKNLSFGKILAIFGGFMVVCLIGAIVAVKMSSKGTSAAPVITKRYSPEESAQPPAQVPQQAPAAPQAALHPSVAAAASAGPVAASQPSAAPQQAMPTTTVSAASTQAAASASPMSTSTGDLGQQLASIDSKLVQFNARLSALEAGKGTVGASAAAVRTHSHRVAPVRTKRVEVKAEEIVEMPKPIKDATGYKSMAVVGNRAWVAGMDGNEESVTAGEAIPSPRPRVRSVDPNTGVVIMTSDERINAR